MSVYTGTFTVINMTGIPLTSVVVTHFTTDYGANTFGPASLPDSTPSTPTALKTSTSNKDRWSVAFIGAGGRLFTGQENCGFESEDNTQNVRIVLNPESWDILMPSSSSCPNNDYSET